MRKIEITDNLYSLIDRLRSKLEEIYKCEFSDEEILYFVIREEMEKKGVSL